MALTTEEVNSIILEQTIGKKKTVKGKAADEFRQALVEDLKRIRKSGHEISLVVE